MDTWPGLFCDFYLAMCFNWYVMIRREEVFVNPWTSVNEASEVICADLSTVFLTPFPRRVADVLCERFYRDSYPRVKQGGSYQDEVREVLCWAYALLHRMTCFQGSACWIRESTVGRPFYTRTIADSCRTSLLRCGRIVIIECITVVLMICDAFCNDEV